jgi:hypothetical protein
MLRTTTAQEPNVPPESLLEALQLAIRAMNNTPSFDTGIVNPARPNRTLRSYDLLPMLEAAVRAAEGRP